MDEFINEVKEEKIEKVFEFSYYSVKNYQIL